MGEDIYSRNTLLFSRLADLELLESFDMLKLHIKMCLVELLQV